MYIIADGYWTQQLGGHRWLLDTTIEMSQMAIGHNSSVVTDGYWTQQSLSLTSMTSFDLVGQAILYLLHTLSVKLSNEHNIKSLTPYCHIFIRIHMEISELNRIN